MGRREAELCCPWPPSRGETNECGVCAAAHGLRRASPLCGILAGLLAAAGLMNVLQFPVPVMKTVVA